MPKIISLPNGQEAEFPDNMSNQDIESVLQRQFSPQKNQQQNLPNNFPRLPDANQNLLQLIPGLTNPQELGKGALQAGGAALLLAQPELFAGAGIFPAIGNAINRIGLGTLGGTALQSAMPGETRNVEDIARKNALLNIGLEALPPVLKGAKKGLETLAGPFSPGKYAEKLGNLITGGQNIESIGKSLAGDIRNKYNELKNNFGELYGSIFGNPNVNNRRLFGTDVIRGTPVTSELQKLDLTKKSFPDSNIANSYETFLKKPNIENAHRFQSELGAEIGYLKKKPNLDQQEKNTLNFYNEVRKAAKNDIDAGLNSISPEIAQNYKNITKQYESEFIPYRSDKILKEIATGKIKNPTKSQIVDIFKNPERSMETVVGHQVPEFKNKIAAIGVGKEPTNLNVNDLLKMEDTLSSKGLRSYLNPELESQLGSLGRKETRKNALQRTASILGGGALGSYSGIPMGEALGAVGGNILGPQLFNTINAFLPRQLGLPELLRQAYLPTGRAIGLNYLNER